MTEGLSDVRWGPTLLLFGQPLATSCLLHNCCLQTLQCSYPTASLIYAQAVQATKSWARQEPIGRPMHFSFLSLPSKELILRSLVSAAVKCIATSFLVLQHISDAQPNIRCCNISQMRKRMMLKQFRATDATLSENPILLKIKLTFAHFFLEFSLSSL